MGEILKFVTYTFLILLILAFALPLLWLVIKLVIWLFGGALAWLGGGDMLSIIIFVGSIVLCGIMISNW